MDQIQLTHQDSSIFRPIMRASGFVLCGIFLFMTTSCGNQKKSPDSNPTAHLASADANHLCENLRVEGIDLSRCDSLSVSSHQVPNRYILDVVNAMSQLTLGKGALLRQPIMIESVANTSLPKIRMHSTTNQSKLNGLVILGYSTAANSNENSAHRDVQAMVAGSLAKEILAAKVLVLSVIETESDQQALFNGSSKIDVSNLQLFEDFKNQTIATSFGQLGLTARAASLAPNTKQIGTVIVTDDLEPLASVSLNPRIILTKKPKCDPSIFTRSEANNPHFFFVDFCPASNGEIDILAAVKGAIGGKSKSLLSANVKPSGFKLDQPTSLQPLTALPQSSASTASSTQLTPTEPFGSSWLLSDGLPTTCVASTCYYKIESPTFETGGPLGPIAQFEISSVARAGFLSFIPGPTAIAGRCATGCYLQKRSTDNGEPYFVRHPVVESSSSGSQISEPSCVNERCYIPNNPSNSCTKIFRYFPGNNPEKRQTSALAATNCAYTESPQYITEAQCLQIDPISLAIQGAGKIDRGNGVNLCSHNAGSMKACGEIPRTNLVATPSANWVFTHWDFEGLELYSIPVNNRLGPEAKEPRVLPSLIPNASATKLKANFQFNPAGDIRVYTRVVDDPSNPLPDFNVVQAPESLFVGPNDNPAKPSKTCETRGVDFCSVNPNKISSMTAVPKSPYHYFDGWWVVDPARYNQEEQLSPSLTLQKNLIPKTGILTAIFRAKPAPTQMTVKLEGAGYGSVLVAAPAYFSPSNGADCKKSAAMSVSCTAELQFREGIFKAQPDAGSYFLRWIFENTEGRDMTNLEKACPPTVATCNLSKAVIPSGTHLIARFGRPTVLKVVLVKGGFVENEGTGTVGSKSWQPPKFMPGSALKCSISSCNIVVADQDGKKNRIFHASNGGYKGGPFVGWQLLDEKNQEVYVPGCFGGSCNLTSTSIGFGWTLRATWISSPAGTIKIKITGPNIPGIPRVSLPPNFMDGQAWPFNSYNTDGEPRYPVYDMSWNVTGYKTNFTHLREQILNIPKDGIISLDSISADPVGACGRLGFSKWIVTRRKDMNGRFIGPDISGDCASGGSCNLRGLAAVESADQYPESIEAVFKLGDPCTNTSTSGVRPAGGGGGSGAAAAPVTTAPVTTAPATTAPVTTAPVTTVPESGGCSWSPVAPGANGCQPGYSVFACANVNGGLPICMQNSCGCGYLK